MSLRIDNSNPTYSTLLVNGLAVMRINQDGSVELPNNPAGAGGAKVVTNANLASFPFTKQFVSTEQTISSADLLTLTHGLGVIPKLYRVSAICKTAEHGYSIGDVLELQHSTDVSDSNSSIRGVSIVGDSNSINVRFVNNATIFSILNKTSGAPASMTAANWRLIVRAWA